jgi:hypothetical protein
MARFPVSSASPFVFLRPYSPLFFRSFFSEEQDVAPLQHGGVVGVSPVGRCGHRPAPCEKAGCACSRVGVCLCPLFGGEAPDMLIPPGCAGRRVRRCRLMDILEQCEAGEDHE